jgi:hypothetical protein
LIGHLFSKGFIVELKEKLMMAMRANWDFTSAALDMPIDKSEAIEKAVLSATELIWDYSNGLGVERESAKRASGNVLDLLFRFIKVDPDKEAIVTTAHEMLWGYFWPSKPLIGAPADRALQITLLTALTGLKLFALLTPSKRDDMAIELLIKIISTEWESLAAIIEKTEAK